ncbi:MAG: 50S ribosomal protein L27, partial [Rhabdaerophilum sp.]
TNVGIGTDHTLFATANGTVVFKQKGPRQYVNVVPAAAKAAE